MPWYSDDWDYASLLTIDSAQVPSNLVNFPLLVHVTESLLITEAQSAGQDILFTSSDNMKLNHEIESFTSGTGELWAWVKVPSISSSSDTQLYMYFGNSGAANQENITGTWDSSFAMVQHLNQDPSGGAPQMLDSTSNNNDGTSSGTMTSGDLISGGQIDNAIQFDGVDDAIDCGSALKPGTGDYTISFWVDMPINNGGDCWVADRPLGALGSFPGFFIGTGGLTTGGYLTVVLEATTGALKDYRDAGFYTVAEGFFYFTATFDNSADTLLIYKNGSDVTSDFTLTTDDNLSGLDITSASDFRISGRPGTTTRALNGVMDEVRVSVVARSADWIAAEYNNQSSPGTFVTFSAPFPKQTGLYSTGFITNINSLYGSQLRELYKLTIHEDPVVEFRYTNNDEDITYITETYEAIFIQVPGLSEGSIARPASVSVTVLNVDRRVSSIFDLYHMAYLESGNIAPLWTLEVWLVNPNAPNDTPIASAMEFEVEAVTSIGLPSSTFKLKPRYMAQDRLSPKEIYTRDKAPFL